MRILLFTGKGGVGKTTAAAATARRAARNGLRTLVVSTDPAHSLADALDEELAPEPKKIAPNLWGQELDVYYSMRKYWGNMQQLMRTVFRWQGVDNILAEELSAIPGMEEGSAFLWIEKYYSEKAYDLIVIDSAPTGETLTLLSLPQITRWWVQKAFPGQRLAVKSIGSVVRFATGVPVDKGYDELTYLFDKLEKIQAIFSNPDVCSIRLVMNPERMVIQEAKRAYTYLQLYGYNVDAVVVNRVLPATAVGTLFEAYYQAQQPYLEDITESFAPLPVLQVAHLGREVFGTELLDQIGDQLYGTGDDARDPAGIYHHENPFEVKETKSGYDIRLKLPFLQSDDFTLRKFGDELVLEIGNRRRNVFLPRFAHTMQLRGHHYTSPWLTVQLAR